MRYGIIGLMAGLMILLIVLLFRRKRPYDRRGFDHNRIHKNGTKYDDLGFDYDGYNAEGYDQDGYNRCGKNCKGQYDRLHDTRSLGEEGFLPPAYYPIGLTAHARERMMERLNIYDSDEMQLQAMKAYRFGKSKRQIRKTSGYQLDAIQSRHDNGVPLIYNNHIYIFSRENVLITVYWNDKVTL